MPWLTSFYLAMPDIYAELSALLKIMPKGVMIRIMGMKEKKLNDKGREGKIRFDFKSEVPQVEKTSLSRLAGIVAGSRDILRRRRGNFLKFIPPLIILILYFLSAFPLLLVKLPVFYINSPVLMVPVYLMSLVSGLRARAPVILFVLFFTLGGYLWYMLVRHFTGRVSLAFLTVLLWISPVFAVEINGSYVRLSAPVFLAGSTGDISHIIGLSLLPLPIYWLVWFLRNPGYKFFLLGAISLSFILLISPFAFVNLFIIAMVFGISEMLLGQGRIKVARLLFIFLVGILLTSFWYHPRVILELFRSNEWREGTSVFKNLLPISFFAVPVCGTILFLIFDRKPHLQSIFIAIILVIVYGLINFSENVLVKRIVPVPMRFLPEFSLSMSLFLATLISLASYFVAHYLIKLFRKTNVWLENIPYLLWSFTIGFMLIWTADIIITALSLSGYSQEDWVGGYTLSLGGLSETSAGGILSQLVGISVSLAAAFFMKSMRKKVLH